MKLSLLIAGLLLVIAQQALADTTLEFNTSDSQGLNKIMIKNGMIRFDNAAQNEDDEEDDSSVMIFDANTKSMTTLNSNTQEYTLMSAADMEKQMQQMKKIQAQMAPQMESMRQQMAAQMASLPEDQRQVMAEQIKHMESMYNPAPAGKKTQKATGKSKQVASINCDIYEIFRGNTKVSAACMASPASLKIPSADYHAIRSWLEYVTEMQKNMQDNMFGASNSDFAGLPDVEGMPIEHVDFIDNETTTLRRISLAPLAADLFKAPANYKRVDMQTMMSNEE